MKNKHLLNLLLIIAILFAACGTAEQPATTESGGSNATAPVLSGQSGVQDNESQKNIVGVAVGSPDHTTLVAAVKAAELVDVLSNAGPFTVFAPTNAAFDALPEGTVSDLLKPENISSLQNILEYHVIVAVYKEEYFKDAQRIEMVNGGYIDVKKEGDKVMINDANILGAVEASNGIVYVVDKVLLPQ